MARSFNGSNQVLTNSSGLITATPLSMACWYRPTSFATNNRYMMAVNRSSLTVELFALGVTLTTGVIRALTTNNGVGNAASSTAGTGTGSWHHAAGVWASATDRRAFLDGGNKGTDATSRTPGTLNYTTIGAIVATAGALGQYFAGDIAEAAMWNVDLTDAEVAVLATGVSPVLVRPESIVGYWPIIGRYSPEPSLGLNNGFPMTVTGAANAVHPRIRYPWHSPVNPFQPPVLNTLSVSGSLASSGALSKQVNTALAGAITSLVGILANSVLYSLSISGGITPTSVLGDLVEDILSGNITPIGALLRLTEGIYSGAITLSGEEIAAVNAFLSGAMSPTGALSTSTTFSLLNTGGITPTGAVTALINNLLSGVITPTGSLSTALADHFGGLGLMGDVTPSSRYVESRAVRPRPAARHVRPQSDRPSSGSRGIKP